MAPKRREDGTGRFMIRLSLPSAKKRFAFKFEWSKAEFEACGGHGVYTDVQESWQPLTEITNDAKVFLQETAKANTEPTPFGLNTCNYCLVTEHGDSLDPWLQCEGCNGYDHYECATRRGEVYPEDKPYLCPNCMPPKTMLKLAA